MNDAAVATGSHAWIDASAGVSGDMLLGALADAGAPLDLLQGSVDAVVPRSTRLHRAGVTRAGLRATKVDVEVLIDDPPRRAWPVVRDLLRDSSLSSNVRERAVDVFTRLADAEARVHGVPVDDVHFHEVGALDSIADVVGVCAGLDFLGVATVSAGEVAVGSGRVATAHGDLPVPVPAVLELARGWRLTSGGAGELATPTGMALIATLAETCEDLPSLRVDGIGIGAGGRDRHGVANVTRVVIGQRAPAAGSHGDAALQLETNVDDLDPRLWPGVLARLLDAGAADAWLTPIMMKKGRPAHQLSVLCLAERADQIREMIFTETTTIGVREWTVSRAALARVWVDLEVDGQVVAIKVAHRDGVIVQVTPEFDTVVAAADASSDRPRNVLAAASALAAASGLVAGRTLPQDVRSTRNPNSGTTARRTR